MLPYHSFPWLYSCALNMLTFGDISLIQKDISSRWVHAKDTILCVNCGSNTQALLYARCGAGILCMNNEFPLLYETRKQARRNILSSFILPVQGKTKNLGNIFKEYRFDIIQLQFLLGINSYAQKIQILQDAGALLKEDGTLILVEKKSLPSGLKHFMLNSFELPFGFLIKMATGVEIPETKDIENIVQHAGYVIYEQGNYFFDTLTAVFLQKIPSINGERRSTE